MRVLVDALCGVIFGAGLAVAGMTNPAKVLGFLDIAGKWDPTLAFVMGGALVVTASGYAAVRGTLRPWLSETFAVPTRSDVDRDLLLGAALFGVGWGMVGLCPGPAIANLLRGSPENLVFFTAMLGGVVLHRARLQARTGGGGGAESTSPEGLLDPHRLGREALRVGTLAGLAMIPFAAAFRFHGLRVNEYGRKTLELALGDVAAPLELPATLAQHLLISWVAAVPLLAWIARIPDRSRRIGAGALYGFAFYAVVNAWALPVAFGDPTPWALGFSTVYPSLVIHLVYGSVIGATARSSGPSSRP